MKNLGFLLLLTACASVSVTNIYAPDGKPAFLVECGGVISRCYKAAEEKCNGPYLPIGKDMGAAGGMTGGAGAIGRRFDLTFRCQ